MYEILPETRPGLMALKVSGKMTKADYDALGPWIEARVAEHPKPAALIVIDDFAGFDGIEAVAEDLKLGVKHYNDMGKVAMVGDRAWLKAIVKLFAPFSRADIEYFDEGDVERARTWLAG